MSIDKKLYIIALDQGSYLTDCRTISIVGENVAYIILQ